MSSFIGVSPKLPLRKGGSQGREGDDAAGGGYNMNESYVSMVKQNFRNLVLTNPGERMMDIRFGVGLRHFLFEQNNESVHNEIAAKITEQTAKYLPFLQITEIDFVFSEVPGSANNDNLLSVDVTYMIVPLSVEESTSFSAIRPAAL